jgi:hypothetical protein
MQLKQHGGITTYCLAAYGELWFSLLPGFTCVVTSGYLAVVCGPDQPPCMIDMQTNDQSEINWRLTSETSPLRLDNRT